MPHPFLIFNQSDYLIQIVKPTDLDLHCLQRQGISGFSRTRVKNVILQYPKILSVNKEGLDQTVLFHLFILILFTYLFFAKGDIFCIMGSASLIHLFQTFF